MRTAGRLHARRLQARFANRAARRNAAAGVLRHARRHCGSLRALRLSGALAAQKRALCWRKRFASRRPAQRAFWHLGFAVRSSPGSSHIRALSLYPSDLSLSLNSLLSRSALIPAFNFVGLSIGVWPVPSAAAQAEGVLHEKWLRTERFCAMLKKKF